MTTAYENQVIGQFIFDLGHYIGRKGKKTFGTVNLFQQTPLDPAMTDIFLGVDSRFFLLEFKMNGEEKSESRKKGIRAAIIEKLATSLTYKIGKKEKLSKYFEHWGEVSALGHWAAISDGRATSFKPYLESINPGKLSSKNVGYLTYLSNFDFIDTGIFSKLNPSFGLSRLEFKEYLNWLFKNFPSNKKKDDNIFFCFAVNKGSLVWSSGHTVKQFFTDIFDKTTVSIPKIK